MSDASLAARPPDSSPPPEKRKPRSRPVSVRLAVFDRLQALAWARREPLSVLVNRFLEQDLTGYIVDCAVADWLEAGSPRRYRYRDTTRRRVL